MKKKSFLITTNIERKFTLKHINFFAGDWCFRFGKLNKRNLDTINIKESIWDNISQREKDYKYLKKLINSHINLLPNYLNKFHNVNYPKKFWRNLLFLWLTYYIPFQYYRWKTLNNIFKEEKNLNYLNFNCLDRKFTSVDSIEFALLASQSDAFNYFHFKRIINFLKENNNIRLNIINKKTKIDLNQLLNAGRRDYHLKIKKHTFSPIKNLIKNI